MKNFNNLIFLLLLTFTATNLSSQDLTPVPDPRPTEFPTFNGNEKIIQLGDEMLVEIIARDLLDGVKEKKGKDFKDKENGCGNIAFDPATVTLCEPTGSFVVNYTGFTPEARRAFQYAVDIWSRVLNLSVPVVINAQFAPLGPNVLGSAGPTFVNRDGAGYPLAGHWYPIALSNQFDGFDVVAGNAHINANFSSEFTNWYYEFDGCPPAGDFDFVTVVLHEIGHGLGFTTSRFADEMAGFGCFGFAGFPWAFDSFLFNNSFLGGFSLNGVPPGCYGTLDQFYTNDDLFWVGPEVVACNGGPAKLYAPSVFAGGSSTAHFDEATYPGVDPNGLMTPFVGRGQAIHDPGCALALLRDLGYDSLSEVPTCEVVPTMGEWGLLSLGLILLILGVVTIKSRKLVFG